MTKHPTRILRTYIAGCAPERDGSVAARPHLVTWPATAPVARPAGE